MTEGARHVVERVLTQDDFDRFARLSGDDNPIHVDPAYSAVTRFGRPVAHGMLLNTIFRGLLERAAPGAALTEQSLMFTAPTYAGEPMRFCVVRDGERGADTAFALRCERVADGTVTCQGEARLRRVTP